MRLRGEMKGAWRSFGVLHCLHDYGVRERSVTIVTGMEKRRERRVGG